MRKIIPLHNNNLLTNRAAIVSKIKSFATTGLKQKTLSHCNYGEN